MMPRRSAATPAFVLPWAVAGALVGRTTGAGAAAAPWLAGAGALAVAWLLWHALVARHATPRIDQAIGAGALTGLCAPDAAVALAIVAWRWLGPGRSAPGWGPAELALPVVALLLAVAGAIGGVGLGALVFWLGPGRRSAPETEPGAPRGR